MTPVTLAQLREITAPVSIAGGGLYEEHDVVKVRALAYGYGQHYANVESLTDGRRGRVGVTDLERASRVIGGSTWPARPLGPLTETTGS